MDRQQRALFYGKVWYVAFFGSAAFINPFINLFLERRGYSPSQIGIVAATRPWVSAAANAFWSPTADRFRCHRPLFIAVFVTATLLTASLAIKSEPFAWAAFVLLAVEGFRGPVPALADAVVTAATTDDHQYGRCRLWGAVAWGSVSVISGLGIELLGFRTMMAIFAVTALSGVWVLAFGLDFAYLDVSAQELHSQESECGTPKPRLVPTAIESSERQSLDAADVQQDPSPHKRSPEQWNDSAQRPREGSDASRRRSFDAKEASEQLAVHRDDDEAVPLISTSKQAPQDRVLSDCTSHDGDAPAPQSFRAKLQRMATPKLMFFIFRSILMGYGMGTFTAYLFLYIDRLGGSPWLMSISIAFTCVSEVPVFHYAGAIIQRLTISGSVNLVLAAFVVRLLAYATMSWWPTLWLVLLVEPLHGLTFGLAWAVGTAFVKESAPPGLEATVQSVFQSSYFGVGTGLGGLMGGWVYDRFSPAATFAAAAVVIAICGAGARLLEAFIQDTKRLSRKCSDLEMQSLGRS